MRERANSEGQIPLLIIFRSYSVGTQSLLSSISHFRAVARNCIPAYTGSSFIVSSICSIQTTFPKAMTRFSSSSPSGMRSVTPCPDSKLMGERMHIPPALRFTPLQSNITLVVIHFTERSNLLLGYFLVSSNFIIPFLYPLFCGDL